MAAGPMHGTLLMCVAVAGCGGDGPRERGEAPARTRTGAEAPIVRSIEARMRSGRNVERAVCRRAGARRFACRLTFSDQPDQQAWVEVGEGGDQIERYDTGTSSGIGTRTLPFP